MLNLGDKSTKGWLTLKLLQRIEEYTLKQKDSKRQIAETILEHKKDLQDYSMEELARLSFSSKSALVRFGKSLDFDGWKDFFQALMEEIHYEQVHFSDIDPNIPFKREDSYKDIINKIAAIQIESIQDTADQFDEDALDEAVNILLKANRVVVLGISPNNLLADVFRRKMAGIGRGIEVIPSGEIGVTAHALKSTDAAIIISYAGNDILQDNIRYVPIMKKNKVKLIALTSEGGGYLRKEIPTILTISSREGLYRKISNFSTEESIMFILNILYSAYFSKNYIQNFNYKVANSLDLEETRRKTRNELKE